MKPTHIEDYLVTVHTGQWFGWSNSKNKIYANLIVLDESKSKPSEQECIDGLAKLQSDYDTAKANAIAKKEEAKAKLLELGLTEEHLKALGL
mgnify:CR=1 FL=1